MIIVITLVIVGFSIFIVLRNFGHNQQIYHRKALAISEYGLMMGLQHLPTSPEAIRNIKKTPYDDGWYKVTFNQFVQNDTTFCTVSSFGHFASATEKRSCLVRLSTVPGDSSWIRERMF